MESSGGTRQDPLADPPPSYTSNTARDSSDNNPPLSVSGPSSRTIQPDSPWRAKQIAELKSLDLANSRPSETAAGTDQPQEENDKYVQPSLGTRLTIRTNANVPAAPIPTFAPESKFKKTLHKFSHKHRSDVQPGSSIPESSIADTYGQMEVIKGTSVGQEKLENTWVTLLNSHQGSKPKLVKVEVSTTRVIDFPNSHITRFDRLLVEVSSMVSGCSGQTAPSKPLALAEVATPRASISIPLVLLNAFRSVAALCWTLYPSCMSTARPVYVVTQAESCMSWVGIPEAVS